MAHQEIGREAEPEMDDVAVLAGATGQKTERVADVVKCMADDERRLRAGRRGRCRRRRGGVVVVVIAGCAPLERCLVKRGGKLAAIVGGEFGIGRQELENVDHDPPRLVFRVGLAFFDDRQRQLECLFVSS